MRKSTFHVALAILMGIATFTIFLPIPTPRTNRLPSPVLGSQTKSRNCEFISALPDPGCTPGAVISGLTATDVCRPDFLPQEENSPGVLDQLIFQYQLSPESQGAFVVDHLVSLSLGGSNDLKNLWPQRAEPRPGFHEKDRVEKYLKDQVCSGQISLQSAQSQLAANWVKVFLSMPSF